MKKILFKAICREDKHLGIARGWVFGLPALGGRSSKIGAMEISSDEMVDIDRKTLCQAIGRTDKKGKEIFEGDKLCFTQKLGKKTVMETLTVYYDEGTASYMLGKNGCGLPVSMFNVIDSEIVGNIYDEED